MEVKVPPFYLLYELLYNVHAYDHVLKKFDVKTKSITEAKEDF